MKPSVKIMLILLLGLLMSPSANSQISTGEKPTSFMLSTSLRSLSMSEIEVMPHLNLDQLSLEDKETEELGMPLRYGYRHAVRLTPENSGQWTTLANGDRIWRLQIDCPDAVSINLEYSRFWIPEGGKFFLYTPDKQYTLGAFTYINNKGTQDEPGKFATDLLRDSKIILEYYHPRNVTAEAIIEVSGVIHGYRTIRFQEGGDLRAYLSSDRNHININCPEGANWKTEKKAIALIMISGNLCSGALINNTTNDYTPLFLTADHCFPNWADAERNLGELDYALFLWDYEVPNCEGYSKEPPRITTHGARILANSDYTDFALLHLSEDPRRHSALQPYYLGWDRSGAISSTVTGIHHPRGDVKKISLSNIPIKPNAEVVNYTNGHVFDPLTLWLINYNRGGIEPGSSGSPLLDHNRRVIGQASGGSSFVDASYGRFDVSWSRNPANTRSLSRWLDPIGAGNVILDGIEAPPSGVSLAGDSVVCQTSTYHLSTLETPINIHWSVDSSDGNVSLISGQGSHSASFRSLKFGKATIKAHVTLPNAVERIAIKEVYSSPSWSPSTPPSHTYADAYTRTMEMVRPNLPALPSGLKWSDLHIRRDTYPHYLNDVEFSMVGDAVKVVTGFQEGDAQAHIYLKTPCQEVLLGSLRVSVTHRNSGGGGLGPIVVYSVGRTLHVLQQEANVATATGLRSLSVPKLRGEVPLTTSSSAPYEVQVWDDSHMVKRHFSAEPHLRLSLEGLSSGLHIVQVLQHGKVVATEKIVLE